MKAITGIIGLFTMLAAILFLAACNKEGVGCFSSTGEIVKEVRYIEPFDSLVLNDNVNLILTADSVDRVVVEAGRNLIPGILTEVSNRQLVIGNTNSCNWTRSFDKPINVYVPSRHLWKINYLSSGDISTTDTVRGDSLKVEVWGGCGRIDMKVNVGIGYFYYSMGTADIILHGICGTGNIFSGDFGLIDTRDMRTGYIFITNEGSNDCYVRANKYLDATIRSIGNIYYTGNPDSLNTYIYGDGKVIRL